LKVNSASCWFLLDRQNVAVIITFRKI